MPKLQQSLIAYASIFVVFVALDVAWLTLVAADLFRQQLGTVLRAQPDLWAASALYLIYPAGLYALAVRPALDHPARGAALTKGALLGCTAYATFDLTSQAIIKGWPLWLSLIDMAWGTLVSAIAAEAGCAVASRASAPRSSREAPG